MLKALKMPYSEMKTNILAFFTINSRESLKKQ